MTKYEKNGSKAVILFHAFTSTPVDVLSLGRALERENYTVLMPTLSGHGEENPNTLLEYGIEDWKKDGEKAYQTLVDDGFTDISVFGLSLGGIVATHVMMNHEVTSYGTFSSPLIPTRKTKISENFWQWYQFKMKKLGHPAEEIENNKDEVLTKLDHVLTGINQAVTKMSTHYPDVKLPVFIGQGGKDEMIDADQAYELKEAMPNAEVSFHWYEDAPHVITTGRVGKELQSDLLEFLKNN